jgi:non-specific protein-tyrosine kinase
MELRRYLSLFRKWAWLVILTTSIAASASYFYSSTLPPTYQATITLTVGQALQNPNPSYADFYVVSQLVQTYALIVKQQPILRATAEVVKWSGSLQSLESKITTNAVGGQFLTISVRDSDPQQAKLIADELARQLIVQSPTGQLQSKTEEQRAFVTAQMDQLKLQIETAQKSLNSLNNEAPLERDPVKVKDLSERITALQTRIDDWQKSYAHLGMMLIAGPSNLLTVIAPATEPTYPIAPNVPQNVLLAALAGLMLGVGTIFLLEYLDDTVKDAEDAQRVLNLSTLGAITRMGGIHHPPDRLITVKHPRSPIAEAYRVLRTNLRFSGIGNPSGALLVTSANPGEGKTTSAANLAVTLAQSGKRVILVDTDLRRPSVDKFFGLPNDVGLSNLFLDDAPVLESIIQPTAVEGLYVIPSGPLPPNPAEILDSKQMDEILSSLRARVDLLILDSPPVLAVADACILGSRCSGAILIIEAGHTRSDVCRRALDTLTQTNVKVFGVVLNKLSTRRASGYYYYYYYSHDGKSRKHGRGEHS